MNAFVFSSTCAIYGEPQTLPMDERHPQAPVSPYGWTKLMVERASADMAAAYGLKFAHLRYFNAAGAAPAEGIGERHSPETHAIPLALFTLLGRREGFKIFGDDYDTRDGTCLRDYVHVLDLADAHVRAVERLLGGGASLAANLGTRRWRHGEGIAGRDRARHRPARARIARPAPRRRCAGAGGGQRAGAPRTGWTPTRGIDAIIADAWEWHAKVEAGVFGG